jgi:arylformamidase
MKMPDKSDNSSKGLPAGKNLIDITIPLRDGMVRWPSDYIPRVERVMDQDKGDEVTLTTLKVTSHAGTHIDAPLHFVSKGGTIDEMPLETMIGPARVIEIKDPESIKLDELRPYDVQRGERILFKTQNSSKLYKTDKFSKEYVYVSYEAAEYLVDRGIVLVALDYLSISKYETEADWDSLTEYLTNSNVHRVHRIFLENGIYILETVNLSGVEPGEYELICLPIKLESGEAGLARAILRTL